MVINNTSILGVLISIVGTGMSEANIIQFGLDQLLESPTHRLIAFIHWYYMYVSLTAGKLLSYYIYAGYSILEFYFHTVPRFLLQYLFPIILAVIILMFKDGIALFLWSLGKKHFYIQSAGLNPFTNIIKVLKYSWKHKVPEHRSAFTYGRRIFHVVLTWERTSTEDHSPMRRWRTLRLSYASYHSSCVCLDTI